VIAQRTLAVSEESLETMEDGETRFRLEVLPTPYTLHPAPYTLHPTPYTRRPTLYTLTPYTLHPYTLHPTMEDGESRFRLEV